MIWQPEFTDKTLSRKPGAVQTAIFCKMDAALSEILIFKLFRTETATPTVPSPAIVIALDIIK
ncbi:hypothetical protein AWE92_27390 [Escherichia coli]|nr:hypothetical protein AWE92_27390 [Escherichia coli]